MSDLMLTVVVPSYNSAEYIEECLKSLEAEQSPDVEYILMDGGSTDETMKIVERYKGLFSLIVSEKDKGQSDAFNKGYAQAKGRYITWLNSDDVFCTGSLGRVVEVLKSGGASWYAANSVYIDADSKVTRCCQSGGFERSALRFGILNVFGPSTIVRRDLFIEAGEFREDFHFCMDTEYWWRLVSKGHEYERIPVYFWALRLHDSAKTASAITGEFDERPPRMQEEGAMLSDMYYPNRSQLKRDIGVLYVRILRVLNCSYIRSIMDTRNSQGKAISSFFQ